MTKILQMKTCMMQEIMLIGSFFDLNVHIKGKRNWKWLVRITVFPLEIGKRLVNYI